MIVWGFDILIKLNREHIFEKLMILQKREFILNHVNKQVLYSTFNLSLIMSRENLSLGFADTNQSAQLDSAVVELFTW